MTGKEEQLVIEHMYLIKNLTDKYYYRYKDAFNDNILLNDLLINYAYEGLINALKTYDPQKGTIFKTWAYTKIEFAIKDAIKKLRRSKLNLNSFDPYFKDDNGDEKAKLHEPEDPEDMQNILFFEELAKALDDCLNKRLTKLEREAVTLNKAQGFSVENIKKVLIYDRSRNTLERLIKDSLRKLKKCLQLKGYRNIEDYAFEIE